jgi:hypothetical protein
MKYKIFELDGKSEMIPDGYNIKTIMKYKLKCDEYAEFFDTQEDAVNHLRKNSKSYSNKDVTILPVFSINYQGEIEGE